MLKKLTSLVLLVLLCVSFLAPANALATTMQKNNTIILELSSANKDDIKDLRYGEGKLFKKIAYTIEKLKQAEEVAEDAQPVIIVVKKKKEKDW